MAFQAWYKNLVECVPGVPRTRKGKDGIALVPPRKNVYSGASTPKSIYIFSGGNKLVHTSLCIVSVEIHDRPDTLCIDTCNLALHLSGSSKKERT